MSTCNPALLTKPLAICTSTITLGTCSVLSANVDVYLKNHTTGRIEKTTVATDGAGTISLDFNDKFNIMEKHDYECWAVTADGGMEQFLDLNVSGASAVTDTVALRFYRTFDSDTITPLATQTVVAQ